MDKLSSITRFKAACPYLGRTKSSTLRTLYTSASPRYPTLSRLTERATQCPVMGPALQNRSNQMVAGYASFAGRADIQKIHEEKGVFPIPTGTNIEKCPHAAKAIAAARMAEDLAKAAKGKDVDDINTIGKKSSAAAPSGCPFHAAQSSKEAAGRSRIIFSWGGNSRGNGAEANPPPLSPPKNPKHTVSTRDFFSTRSLRTRGVYVSLS